MAIDIAEGHHEWWDGSGYPRGSAAREIPLSARIVAIADVYDALSSRRPYKEPWPRDQVLTYIAERSGTQFDAAVATALLKVLEYRAREITHEWDDSIAIGHPDIDHDHRILLELVNQMMSPRNIADVHAIEFVLDELVGYTHFHFDREEAIMAAAGYPDIEEHRRKHRALFLEVANLRKRFADESTVGALGEEISRILYGWLIDHIMHEDRKLIPSLGLSS